MNAGGLHQAKKYSILQDIKMLKTTHKKLLLPVKLAIKLAVKTQNIPINTTKGAYKKALMLNRNMVRSESGHRLKFTVHNLSGSSNISV